MSRGPLLIVLLFAVLAGCVAGPTVTVTAPPPVTSPGSPDPTRPTAPMSTSPATPSVPPLAGALNVSGHAMVDFASPTGRIWCGMRADVTLCHFPFGYTGQIPASADVCPSEGLDVTGVNVVEGVADYFCSGDPQAMPDRGTPQVAWRRGTGFPFVSFDGHSLATLPYGESLRYRTVICSSEPSGITCGDDATGHGFRVARAGVVLF